MPGGAHEVLCKGASSRGKQLPKAAVEMLSKSLECDLEHLLKCFAERGAPAEEKVLGQITVYKYLWCECN